MNYELLKIPKRKAKVVNFLESEDVTRLIDCVFAPRAGYSKFKRLRNRAIISLLYSSGVRLSELVSIDCIDIKKDRTFTVIGKGAVIPEGALIGKNVTIFGEVKLNENKIYVPVGETVKK